MQRAEMSARNLTFEKRVRNTLSISLVDDALQNRCMKQPTQFDVHM